MPVTPWHYYMVAITRVFLPFPACFAIGDFGLLHVPHRGNIIHNVVDNRFDIASGFNDITRLLSDGVSDLE